MKTAQNNFITTSMQQKHSWQGNSSPGSQEIPCILWLLKVHYHAHKNLQIIPILIHINPLQCPPIRFPNDPFPYYLPINANVLQMLSFLKFSPPKPCMNSLLPHTCHTFLPALLVYLCHAALHPNQHTYQAGKSVEMALHQLIAWVEKALDQQENALSF